MGEAGVGQLCVALFAAPEALLSHQVLRGPHLFGASLPRGEKENRNLMLAGSPHSGLGALGRVSLLFVSDGQLVAFLEKPGQAVSLSICLCVCLSPLPHTPIEQLSFLVPTVCWTPGRALTLVSTEPHRGAGEVRIHPRWGEQEARPQRDAVPRPGRTAGERVRPGVWRTDHGKARRAWPGGSEHWCLVEETYAR